MRGWRVTLALCVIGVWYVAAARQQPAERRRRSTGVSTDRWANFLADYFRGAGGAGGAWGGGGAGGFFAPPIPIQVPLQSESSGRASIPQLLLVPVPVPVPAPSSSPAQCQLNPQQAAAAPTAGVAPARTVTAVTNDVPGPMYTNTISNAPTYKVPEYTAPQAAASSAGTNQPDSTAPPSPPRGAPRRPPTDERLTQNAPRFPPSEDPQLLVEQFQAQVPSDPTLPPVGIEPIGIVSADDYTVEELQSSASSPKMDVTPEDDPSDDLPPNTKTSSGRRRLKCRRRNPDASADDGPAAPPAPPPPPRFERSLFLRARLTVPRADYTEPYSVWWDAASGASRVDFHGGTTSTYRMMKRDGRVQSVKISVDRTGAADVRRCAVSAPRRVSLAERGLPALPELQAFSFAGHVLRGAERAERWRYTLSGHRGELGAAQGEALTFRHNLLLSRASDNFTITPIWYSVRVDSSMLGADCDGYVHYFDKVEERHHDPAMFNLDIADACEQVETTNRMETVEPLREFTMLRRDPRYDTEIEQYKRTYQRLYADDSEEAVRKNVYMQSARHSSSGNRQGASFELGTNFLSDRLAAERRVLLGAAASPAAGPGERFPHSRAELDALRGRLPRKFDWRERGGVTPVRNQGMCSSCWAFATVGAVEGALFVETNRLVALSEQTLVDCAQPYGGNGCHGTWPSFAYNYIQDNGLPALEDYTPYKSDVLQCRADSVPAVTRVSGHVNVTKDNIVALKVAIKKYGPTVVIIDGEFASFTSYKKGYYHDTRCRRNKPNHAVLAVGWTVHRGETYFILKNSWSTGWGEEGYVRMRGPTNACGVLSRPSYPRLRARDVQRVPAAAPSVA